jgi:hypothetical protein
LANTHDTFDDDFGFSTVDIQETLSYNQEIEELTRQVSDLTGRLNSMYIAIDYLLTNLSKNPEQELIKWPDRVKKIEQFRLKLQYILTGEV